MKKALILQGWYQKPDKHWYPWLKKELEKRGYEVYLPDDDLTVPEHKLFWQSKINHSKIKQNVKEIYCISSDNDPYTTAVVTEQMSKRLSGKFILLKGKGHFTEKFGVTKIPELLKYS
ncbi:MAG: hypothetical protein UT23_C0005G0019 [Candidatus Woesebacteria bacterium GW2011_GWA1_39_12]|uniref:Alpha/beta hydrolase n=1 Tax=Candidatus Woesebacteria bacterium GW2011_GWA1_39_12 TaxID=1618549 RepID=A0A0G0Q8V7_9BACT|nr:MAG: hypothetical protein UT23_C0005G0019 [Candidatus Woesebacteria bacterium GW2011_GWA1_39_12]